MPEPLQLTFRKDVNFENCVIDAENILTRIADTLALQITQSEFPAMIVTGESSNANGIAAYSAQRLIPGIRLRIQSMDFNYDTGENRISGGSEPYTMALTVVASADAEPGVIVRRDIDGNFGANQITATSIVMNYPNIVVTGQNIFDQEGNIIADSKGTADNAVNITNSIGNIDLSDIFVTNVSGNITSTVKDAYNVTNAIAGVSIKGNNNDDPSTGVFRIGINSDGSDTYAKRALVANEALSLTINGQEVESGNFARLDADNTFESAYTSTFGRINTTNFTATNATITTLSLPTTAATARPTTPAFYTGSIEPTGQTRVNFNGYLYATRVGNAMYNDLAECFVPKDGIKYEDCKHRIMQIDNNGHVELAQPFSPTVIGVVSDNYGYLLGGDEEEIKKNKKIPIGLSGTLWVDLDDDKYIGYIQIGEFVCSGKDGKAHAIPIKETNDVKYNNTIVGKIIELDKKTRQAKILLTLR